MRSFRTTASGLGAALILGGSLITAPECQAQPRQFCPPNQDPDCYFVYTMMNAGAMPTDATPSQISHAIGMAQDACSAMLADTGGGNVPLRWALRFTAQHPELRPSDQAVSKEVATFALLAATAYCPSVRQ